MEKRIYTGLFQILYKMGGKHHGSHHGDYHRIRRYYGDVRPWPTFPVNPTIIIYKQEDDVEETQQPVREGRGFPWVLALILVVLVYLLLRKK